MTIHSGDNDYDLDCIEVHAVDGRLAVGDMTTGRACFRDWRVHWRDKTTLMIAPANDPDAWRPTHIYRRGGGNAEVGWDFFLEPIRRGARL